MRGQVSLEYLFIVGLALAIIIPGAMLFYQYSKSSNDELVSAEIARAGNEVINVGEEAYVTGENSWRTVRLTFPEAVTSMWFVGNRPSQEMVIQYWTDSGLTEAVFFVPASVEFRTYAEAEYAGITDAWEFNVSEGINSFRLQAMRTGSDQYVLVTS
jgi:hypothetical protein